jgi:hypothetical protein
VDNEERMSKHSQRIVPLDRIRVRAARFRAWLEDRNKDTRPLDGALSPSRLPCAALDEDFRAFEEWFSTSWEDSWGLAPDEQRRQLDLRNRVIEAQIAQDRGDR